MLLGFQDLVEQRLLKSVVVRVTPTASQVDDERDEPWESLLVGSDAERPGWHVRAACR
jgi:hypothetical protein